jgi:hypothetical protein
MNKTLFILMLICSKAYAVPILISSTDYSSGENGTSAAINTTGATLLVGCLQYFTNVSGIPSLSDSKSNVWTSTISNSSANNGAIIFYSSNPIVGTSHTFTAGSGTTGGGTAGFFIGAWSGITISTNPLDGANTNPYNSGSPLQTGSITPSKSNDLFVACMTGLMTTGISINSGFTVLKTHIYNSGVVYGGAFASYTTSSTSAENPSFSWTDGSVSANAVMAAFVSNQSVPNKQIFFEGANVTIKGGKVTIQ